jgi:hypothetical protein
LQNISVLQRALLRVRGNHPQSNLEIHINGKSIHHNAGFSFILNGLPPP